MRAATLFALVGVGLHAPEILALSITASPPASTASAHATFVFEEPSANAFECALDGAAFSACQSPATYVGLAPGAHRWQVRAIGLDGTPGASVEHRSTQTSIANGGHPDLQRTTQQPAPVPANGWRGILRINCDFSHEAYDDPLVYPGRAWAAHLHRFYGLFDVNAGSTVASMHRAVLDANGRVSSCQGNDLNRSAYWVPALLAPDYDGSGTRRIDRFGQPAWESVAAVVGADDEAHEVFYYSAGIDQLSAIQPLPTGLSMIAGDMRATPGAPQSTAILRWHCQSWNSNDATNPRFSATIPECALPDRLRADLFFPSCWNGRDLDSADHRSHMAYPVTDASGRNPACPATHPVPVVRVSYHYAFPVKPDNADPATRSTRGWRLSSDMYEVSTAQPGGASLHGDWINGWHPEAMRMIVDGCIGRGLDCHDGNLGNGWRLSGTAAGPQTTKEVIAQGMGPRHVEHFGGATVPSPLPTVRGLWYDRARDGHGIDLQTVGDSTMVLLYSYDAERKTDWRFGVGRAEGAILSVPVAPFTYAQARQPRQRAVGGTSDRIDLRFDNAATHPACQDGVDRRSAPTLMAMEARIDGQTLSWCLEPLPIAGHTRAQPDLTGSWYAGEQDTGWGLSIQTHQSGTDTVTVAIAYYYDAEGRGRWVFGSTRGPQGSGEQTLALHDYRGYCRTCLPTAYETRPAGELRLRLGSGSSGTADLRIDDGAGNRWSRLASPLISLSNPP